MLNHAILEQLRVVFEPISAPVTLVMTASAHPKQAELEDMLASIATCSTAVSVQKTDLRSNVPTFTVEREGAPTGMAFVGIPGGHELSSLVLSILYAAGLGKRPDTATIERIQRLQGPIRLRTYISLSCENCPDAVQALHLIASLHQDAEHTMVDGGLVPDEVEALSIRGVPSVMVGDTLVSSGRASMADLLERLEAHFGTEERQAKSLGHTDVMIVGGGPAGVSAAIYAARKGLKTTIVTDRLGGQLMDTKGIENLVSVPYIEGPQLTAKLDEHLRDVDVDLLQNRRVAAVRPGRPIQIELLDGDSLTTDSLIVATGAKWRELGVPGEKEYLGRGVAFCPHCDGPMFKGKNIVVVGGGNSGVEAAIDLSGIVRSVAVLELGAEARADAVLLNKLNTLDNATLITNAKTVSVNGDTDGVTSVTYLDVSTDEQRTLDVAGVFVQIGLVPNSGFVADVVAVNRFGEIEVDEKSRTNQPGIYAAGDVTTTPFKQIIVAMGDGAQAALSAFEDRMLA